MNNDEFMQTPSAKVISINNICVLVLSDWNVENELSGYTTDEVKQLINMLNDSLEIMNKYNEANESLPLFEKVGDTHVQQKTQSFG